MVEKKKKNNILRKSCALLAATDIQGWNELKRYFAKSNAIYLYEKLANNVTILNAILFSMDEDKDIEAMGKNFYGIQKYSG